MLPRAIPIPQVPFSFSYYNTIYPERGRTTKDTSIMLIVRMMIVYTIKVNASNSFSFHNCRNQIEVEIYNFQGKTIAFKNF